MLVVPAFKHLDTFATVGFTVDLAANVLPDGFVLGAMATLFVVDEAAANVLVADTVELGDAADRRRGGGPFGGIESFLFLVVRTTTTVKRLFITIVRTVPVRVIAHPHRNNNDSDYQQDGYKPIHPIMFVDESERGRTRGTGTGHCKRDTKEIEKRLKRAEKAIEQREQSETSEQKETSTLKNKILFGTGLIESTLTHAPHTQPSATTPTGPHSSETVRSDWSVTCVGEDVLVVTVVMVVMVVMTVMTVMSTRMCRVGTIQSRVKGVRQRAPKVVDRSSRGMERWSMRTNGETSIGCSGPTRHLLWSASGIGVMTRVGRWGMGRWVESCWSGLAGG